MTDAIFWSKWPGIYLERNVPKLTVSVHFFRFGFILTGLQCRKIWRAFVVFSNGTNSTIGRQIPFKVLPMVPMAPM